MKRLGLAVFFVFCGVAYCRSETQYTNKYDSIDLDAVIRNDRLLRNYVDCILEKKKCTKDGAELKRHIPDALQNNCQYCSEFQKNGSRQILRHLIINKRDWFNELEAKYDPLHVYRQQYEAEIKKAGVTL